MNDFDKAFQHVIGLEGGYVNDLRDPGGETKFGISHKAYPSINIKDMTLDQAKELYRNDYWIPAKCDLLPYPLNMYVFDCAVNQGVSVSARLLQQAAKVKVDFVIGQITLDAIKRDPEIAHKFMVERAIRYFGSTNFDTFGKGWLKRIFKLAREA